jgi:hypothetical protein
VAGEATVDATTLSEGRHYRSLEITPDPSWVLL